MRKTNYDNKWQAKLKGLPLIIVTTSLSPSDNVILEFRYLMKNECVSEIANSISFLSRMMYNSTKVSYINFEPK